jgi:1-aminocyclopropane-1-carboxylate deaminase/D-cysteine desulfhydrase-like pyridoxal-dependent ACC family enzyme
MSPHELTTLLAALPRMSLAAIPTPLRELPRLTAELRGPRIFIKQDDLSGLAFGGNKIRQLEFFIGEALADKADVLIAGGNFAQSNHSRAAAAAARAAGLIPVIAVRPGGNQPHGGGNALLTRLLAADVRVINELGQTPRHDRLAEVQARKFWFERLANEYRQRGHRPYVLLGTSVPLGVMGYVLAAIEMRHQFDALRIDPNWIVVASMGVTQAGLVLGRRLLGETYSVVGMAYQPTGGLGGTWITNLCMGAASLLGVHLELDHADVVNDDREAGEEYGVLSAGSRAAFDLVLATEGLFLDPVYGAKGMAGLIRWIREGRITSSDTVVFIHTGGLPALFAYGNQLLS